MMYLSARTLTVVLSAASALMLVGTAGAQEPSRSPGFLDNLFGGNNSSSQPAPPVAEPGASELTVRIDRLEARIRELTGAIEQLQFRNQQLEQQVQRMSGATAPDPNAGRNSAQTRPLPPAQPPAVIPATPGRRGDVFDPAQNPNAPGAPQTLGSVPPSAAPNAPPIGAPGGRPAGAPLDLSTLSGASVSPPQSGDPGVLPPPPRNPNAPGAQVATLPPSQTPRDEFDLAYGYIKHKDYALAEQSLRGFLRKYPSDAMVAEAQYWLGESLYQRQRYRDAAESFLAVTTKYESNPKAPEALLRLGQSLAALDEKETACAALGEIARKYPNASAGVKKGVAAEQKRVRC